MALQTARELRAMPSGHVHLWVRMWMPGFATPWYESACGLERTEDRLTADFPPGCKRCPKCLRYQESGWPA